MGKEGCFVKILIAGYGMVGETLAHELARSGHDLTLMDSDRQVLEAGMERDDVMAVQGNCASMRTLRQAGVEGADLLIATTGSDELNLLCCMTAHVMNPRLHTIARIRNPEYAEQAYLLRDALALSMAFNPEHQSALEISRLLKFPGFFKRDSFAKGRVEIVEIRVEQGSRLVGVPLYNLNGIVKCRVLVCTVLRGGKALTPRGDFVLQEGDRLFVTAPSNDLALLLKNLEIVTRKIRRVMIAGGGTIAYYLTELLRESQMEITIVESNRTRCEELAAAFPYAEIICGDPRDKSLLEEQGIGTTDALIALTESDELNMVISLYGHSCNIPQVVTRMENLASFGITDELPLGSVLATGQLSCSNILRYVRALQNQSGAALTIHSIADGQAEAMEFRVDKNTLNCGVPLKKLKLKKNVLLVCISRGTKSEIPNGDSTFAEGDLVLVVAGEGTVIEQINDIFV